ncbi:MAG: CBS domain-containing protein [Hyphomonadaceae bacterium]
MKINQAMTRAVRTAAPDATIRDAAKMMIEGDVGLLPVEENDRLIGMITDRDIAVRAVAEGKGPDASVREVMSGDVKYCYEDEDVETVCRNMGDIRVRRLPVVSRDKRLVGIVSLADIAANGTSAMAGQALGGITQKGAPHSQRA